MNNLRENENVLHKYSTPLFLLLLLYLIIGTDGTVIAFCLFHIRNTLIFSVPLQFNKHAPVHTLKHTHTRTPVHKRAHTLYFQFSTGSNYFSQWGPVVSAGRCRKH